MTDYHQYYEDLKNADYVNAAWNHILVNTQYGYVRSYTVRVYEQPPVLAYVQEHIEQQIIKSIELYEFEFTELGLVDRRYVFVWGCIP
jgi:hypothetical protein